MIRILELMNKVSNFENECKEGFEIKYIYIQTQTKVISIKMDDDDDDDDDKGILLFG